jgi:sugar O-acyltransferase (sialic acid O-acetyltransferase NeuD family)
VSSAKPLVIFGVGELADLAHFYFTEAGRRIAAFTVDAAYLRGNTFHDAPAVAFETISESFPPSRFEMFVAIGYRDLNCKRSERCAIAIQRGYRLASFASPKADLWPGLAVGANCLVMEGNVLQPYSRLGVGVILGSGNLISHHAVVEDYCYLAARVVIGGAARVGHHSFVGLNVTVREKVRIGASCLVGAAALVLKDVPDGQALLTQSTQACPMPATKVRSLL